MILWGIWSIFVSHAVPHSNSGRVVALTYLIGLIAVLSFQYENLSEIQLSTRLLGLSIGAGIAMSLGTLAFYRSIKMSELSVAPTIAGLYFVVTIGLVEILRC